MPALAPSQSQLKYHRTEEQQARIYENMTIFLDEFLPECHQKFTDLMAGEIPPAYLPVERADWWVLDPAFVKLLAGCYQNWKSSDDDTDALAAHIRSGMKFERNVPAGRSAPEELGLIDDNGARKKPIRKTSLAWKEAAVKICHAAREASS